MVDSNDAFLRELKQELDREKYEQLWQRYGVYLIAGLIAFLVAVIGFQLWRAYTVTAAQEAGAQYEVALEHAMSGRLDEATEGFEKIAKSGPRGYAALSQLQLAANHLEAGKKQEALAAFEKLADDAGADPLLKDFARLQAAAIQLGTADWTEMQNRLTDLTKNGNPWRHSARELLALAALEAGEMQVARELLDKVLTDPEAPPGTQERARIRMEGIVAEDLKAAPRASAPAAGEDPAAAVKTVDAKPAADGDEAEASSPPADAGK